MSRNVRMRYIKVLLVALFGFPLAFQSFAQANETVMQYYEERLKTLSARVEELTQAHSDLVSAINKLQRQCNILAQQVDSLREIVSTPAPPPDLSNTASLSSVEQLKEVLITLENRFNASEEERRKDSQRLMAQLDKIAQIATASPTNPKPSATSSSPDVVTTGKAWEWTIEAGDTLSSIVQEIKARGGNTSVSAILKANRKLNPNALQIGQKIIIPDTNN